MGGPGLRCGAVSRYIRNETGHLLPQGLATAEEMMMPLDKFQQTDAHRAT